MFGFRKLAYTLLSRHFWVGIGIGFFCASLFFASQALASETKQFSLTSPYWNNDNAPTAYVYKITTNFQSPYIYLSQIHLGLQNQGNPYTASLKNGAGTVLTTMTATTTGVSSPLNERFILDNTVDCSSGDCYFHFQSGVVNIKVSNISSSTVLQTVSNITPLVTLYGSDVLPYSPTTTTTPLLNYSFTLGNIASTSCVGSSTSSQCTHYYYPNFTPVTPVNLFVFFITFFISFTGTAFIIRKLT